MSTGRRTLPRSRRLTRGAALRALMQRGKRSKTPHLDVFDSPSPEFSRVGVIVPRHRHTAVARNRLKRRLRELLRTELLPRLEAEGARIDVVVRARREAYAASHVLLKQELTQWLSRRLARGSSSR